MPSRFLAILLSAYSLLITASVAHDSRDGTHFPTDSYWCDDTAVKDLASKVDLLAAGCDNLRLKWDVLQLRYEQEFVAQRQLMEGMKMLLQQQYQLALATSASASGTSDAAASSNSATPAIPSLSSASSSSGSSSVTPTPPSSGCTGENIIDVRTSFHEDVSDCAANKTKTHTQLPTSCDQALFASNKSGIYQLHLPHSGLKPFYVYCLQDPNHGAAWTLVQRRQDGSQDFYRDWQEYKQGFGNLNSEFFLGLEQIHAITHSKLHELWIEMVDFEDGHRNAHYESFAIGDEDSKYALNVLGTFSGDAGDSLAGHEGRKFSTKDQDNDQWGKNCAIEFTGAWWYAACHKSNLNGQYLKGEYEKDKFAKGINWKTWHGHYYSMKYVHLAIRPVK